VVGDGRNPDEGYRSGFDDADERMEPGYYSVLLKDYKVHAKPHRDRAAGLHRYTLTNSRIEVNRPLIL
jgi:putative alpha-1,2-mannosidase